MPYTDFHYTPTGTGVISGKEVLEQTEDAINDLGTQISGDVETAINTANNALNTANQASTDAQNAVNTANIANTAAQNAQNTANAAQNTASNALTAAQNAQNDVNALGNRVTTAEGNITQNTTDITNLTTRMGTAEGNITTLQNDVQTAQGTATSAQITANLAREQAYVLRYASSTVTPNSTIAYTVLNNTDNVKMGDSLIDASGQVFLIVSVDSVNETVTVSAVLLTLALDSNVMHLSGNETAGGTKDFSEVLRVYNSNSSSNTAQMWLKNSKVNRGQPVFGDQVIWFRDTTDKPITALISRVTATGASALLLQAYNVDQNNQQVSNYLSFIKYLDGSCYLLPDQNDVIVFGNSAAKLKNVNTSQINGLNPSSLSMPTDNISNVIDISGYITVLDGSLANTYQAPSNGYIGITLSNSTGIQAYITGFWGNQLVRPSSGAIRFFMPICKGMTANIFIFNGTLDNARFFPCQGNV